MSTAAFASIVLDVDSTLCGVEGIDWLAARCDAEVSARVADLTRRAMSGEIALHTVYGERLALVSPTRESVLALSAEYARAIAPGASDVISRFRAAGIRVVLVSGGIREAIIPLAMELGFGESDVHAVSLRFGDDGRYTSFDAASPLTTSTGKRNVVEALGLTHRILAVGDGITDLAMRPAVDAFAAFTGFVYRSEVTDLADVTVASFDHLVELVLT